MRLWIVVVCVTVLLAGCGTDETGDSKNSQQSGSTEEETKVVTQIVTVEETASSTIEGESSAAQEGSPEDVLALQYEYINREDFESAYSLFAGQSRQEVSLAQYRAFFEDNAPYSVTGYSFSPARIEGNSASLDAEFTVTSASGVEQLQRTQRFVRENGEWRVLMRPEQVAVFTAEDDEEVDTKESFEPKQSPKTKAERGGAAADEVVLRVSGTDGVPYRGSFGGIAESVTGRQPIEGTIGQGQNEYRLSEITGDVQVRTVSATANKSRPGIQGDLRLQILYQGEVVAENLATGTASFVGVPWTPGRP